MSRLVEKLEKVDQASPKPMGFRAAAKQSHDGRSILLLGTVTPGKLSRITKHQKTLVDAFLVELDPDNEKVVADTSDALEGFIWGASASQFDTARITALKEAGCDFIVFEASGTAAEVLNDQDLGKFIRVSGDLAEDVAAAIHDLPLDGALLSPDTLPLPLSVRQIIELQRIRGMLGKLFVVEASNEIGSPDLEVVRDGGTTALLVDAVSKSTADLASRVDALPPKRPRQDSRDDMVPRVPAGPHFGVEPYVDDDDEEDY
ncbi:MAG: hypothetical protein O3A47_10950 [Chloroflexi bacterium]|nr:hypothetical protein [Chloroflexota bacterium]